MAEPRLTDPQTYPDDPRDTCDMIMKGGITSGVVYPRAACWLATRFRFRQIGGASAGAIAAAAVAAAESGRRVGGFPKLYALPTELDDLLERMRGVYDGEKSYATLRTLNEAANGRYGLDSLARAEADQAATAKLMDLAEAWTSAGHPANSGRVPRPKPSLRIVPRQ